MSILSLPQPYLLFLGDAVDERDAKTAMGLRDWAGDRCVGEFALPGVTVTTGLPRLTPAAARARGAQALVIGVAPAGGIVQPSWIPALLDALRAGLDLVSGMHTRLDDVPVLRSAALELGRRLIDVRKPRQTFPVGTGRRRSGRRLLTVGTDCALGKKYTALGLVRAFEQRGVSATFRATGQTGVMISGSGVVIDSVVADFIAGAAEALTPDAAADHWDVVEGQGSLFHPAYSGVSLGLLHGTQPDVIVMCHEAGRKSVHGLPDFDLPGLREAIDVTLTLARRTNPGVRCAGVSLNTVTLSVEAANALLEQHSIELGMPCADPIRGGARFDELVTECLRG
ncbi:DUF1611 domain-containing protein [Steroidobacter agaridevorans]|uniref:DUF1611 domain-containing protein n=1 Tax=Steroidobacter agaridevorans TaxID=2695856 RepID=UPI001322929B|nr:DUF1611 domain-containing protein [Steroidobacter agaridevorans]GFE87586.1 hypothetical protein GCM10011488_25400 [Steroidobacter agaridevorans]